MHSVVSQKVFLSPDIVVRLGELTNRYVVPFRMQEESLHQTRIGNSIVISDLQGVSLEPVGATIAKRVNCFFYAAFVWPLSYADGLEFIDLIEPILDALDSRPHSYLELMPEGFERLCLDTLAIAESLGLLRVHVEGALDDENYRAFAHAGGILAALPGDDRFLTFDGMLKLVNEANTLDYHSPVAA